MNIKLSNPKIQKSLLAGLLTAVFLYLSKPFELLNHLMKTDPLYYILSLTVFLTVYPLTGLRWQVMTSKVTEISLEDSVKTLGISYGINKILPLNSGDLVRSKIQENYTEIDKHGEILGIVALERIIDISVLLLFLTTSILLYFSKNIGITQWIWIPILGVASTFSVLYLYEEFVKSLVRKIPGGKLPLNLQKILIEAIEGFNSLDKLQYSKSITLTLLRWTLDIFSLYLLSIAAGYPIGFWTAALLTCSMSLVSSMPITPSGAGAAELSGSAILISLGMSSSIAGTIVILQRSLGVGVMGIIGIVLLKSEGLSFGQFKS